MAPLPAVTEDPEGEELEEKEAVEWRPQWPVARITDFVVHNRIRKQFGNSGERLSG